MEESHKTKAVAKNIWGFVGEDFWYNFLSHNALKWATQILEDLKIIHSSTTDSEKNVVPLPKKEKRKAPVYCRLVIKSNYEMLERIPKRWNHKKYLLQKKVCLGCSSCNFGCFLLLSPISCIHFCHFQFYLAFMLPPKLIKCWITAEKVLENTQPIWRRIWFAYSDIQKRFLRWGFDYFDVR